MTADYQHIGIALAGMTRRLQLCSLCLPLFSRLGLASALDNARGKERNLKHESTFQLPTCYVSDNKLLAKEGCMVGQNQNLGTEGVKNGKLMSSIYQLGQ